jgi:cationic peptide transport system permease protein
MAGYPDQRPRAARLLDPVFWLALLLTLFLPDPGLVPVSGRFDLLYEVKTVTGFALIDAWLSDSPWRHEMIVSAVRHMVLPVLTLAVAPTTEVIRLMRISTSEVFDTNYVKAAATRGVSRRRFCAATFCTTPCRR